MTCHKKLITLVILSLLLKVALSTEQHGVVVGKDIYKWNFLAKITVAFRNDMDIDLIHSCNLRNPFPVEPGRWKIFEPFRKEFRGRTRINCKFSFGGETHHFYIYRNDRDNIKNYQCQFCSWSIRRNGPCALDSRTQRFDICYAWDK